MPKHLIIGLGSIGKRYKALLEKAGEEVIGVDKGDVFSWDDADWIWICTPPKTHHEFVITALEAGKTVICEKPLTVNMKYYNEIKGAYLKNNRLWICCNYRFHPAIEYVKENLPSLGRIFYSKLYFSHYLPNQKPDYINSHIPDTGILLDTGWHFVDLAQWLFGSVYTNYKISHRCELEMEDFFKLELRHLNSKCLTFIQLDYLRRDKVWGITIVGEKGSIEMNMSGKEPEIAEIKYNGRIEDKGIVYDDMYRNQIDYLLQNKWKSNFEEMESVLKVCA